MWLIIGLFGIIGGYVTEKSNEKISNFSFTVGFGAATVFMLERMVIRNGEGIMFYYDAIIALVVAILTISFFIGFMKKL